MCVCVDDGEAAGRRVRARGRMPQATSDMGPRRAIVKLQAMRVRRRNR